MKKLLIIDDEQSITWGLTRLGQEMGLEVQSAASAESGLELAAAFLPDAIVLDVRLPGMSGLESMRQLHELTGDAPIIITTAYGDLETAVAAVATGGSEYVVKPFDTDQIQLVVQRAMSARTSSPKEAPRTAAVAGFIGDSPAMQRVYNRIALAASGDVPVLLQGESGVGKELAARAIHRFSLRSAGPFVVVNLAALNPSLAESELFGHVRGAFTGADQARTGLLAAADGGTLFLDEVAEIPLPTQVKLLRVLEQGELAPVGSDATRRINFRLVCATHRDLPGMVRRGEFRHDLFFRITAFQIDIPPLRDRPEDLDALAEHFVAEFGGERRPSLSRACARSAAATPLGRQRAANCGTQWSTPACWRGAVKSNRLTCRRRHWSRLQQATNPPCPRPRRSLGRYLRRSWNESSPRRSLAGSRMTCRPTPRLKRCMIA